MSADPEVEPIPGLPHALPPGEHILWQGRPRWRGLARHTFQVRWLTAYFAVLGAARGALALADGQGIGAALAGIATVLPLGALCLGILCLLAWLHARATVYTITTRRVVMRLGIALPMTFNLPFKRTGAAHLRMRDGGDGDIALQLLDPDRIAWLHLWPHTRPWHFAKAQPMLRAIPQADRVAALLAEAVRAWSAAERAAVLVAAHPSPGPSAAAQGRDDQAAPAPVPLGAPLTAEAGR